MRWCTPLALCGLLAACGNENDGSLSAELGWQFDYKNWKDPSATPDPRGCDNQATAGGPAYSPIDKVRVVLEDPEGQVPGSDQTYLCGVGVDARVPIRGLVRQVFTLRIEALSAAGRVLYREVSDLDLSSMVSKTYDVPNATGELHFIPLYDGASACPAGLDALRYTLYQEVDGEYGETHTLQGTQHPACSGGLSDEIYIREIPVDLSATSTLQTNNYKIVLEGLDAGGGVLYCGVNPRRAVKLGDNNGWQNEALVAGACP